MRCKQLKDPEVLSRRVDIIDGEHLEGLPSIEGCWAVVAAMASLATMAPMVWLAQGSIDTEVPLVLGVGEWRRMAAWTSLCVATTTL